MTSTDDLLNEWLDRWEERRRIDPDVTIEEICADRPDLVEPLARRIASLREMDDLLGAMASGGELSASRADGFAFPPEGVGLGPFDGYELIEEIARGGMGVVYKARERNPARLVALKMIRPDRFPHPSDKRRFLVEAETAANLSHPHIIRIYKVGEHRGQLYFTMMLFERGSLARRIEEAGYSGREAASLVRSIALAVHAAHRFGVLHRDLKPSNILLDEEGRPHVADFGLAKRIGEDSGATRTGDVLGTPCYMAPEQVAGHSNASTIATDVYGLGAILYESLTRRKPFEGATTAEVIAQVQGKEPRRPRSIDPQIGRDLESIVLKCLEKDPARRYRSAEDLAEDLDRWLDGKPIRARPIGIAERSLRWCRRNPLVAGLVVAVATLLVASMFGVVIGVSRIVAEQKATAAALEVAEARAIEAEEQRRIAEAGKVSVFQGITEPLKKLADPDLARDPNFVSLRHEILGVAVRVLRQFMITTRDTENVAFQLHIGLLRTADGDHPGAQEAYRTAIDLAERRAQRLPDNFGTWDQLGQAHSHLGMELWERGLPSEAGPHLRRASEAFDKLARLAAPGDFISSHHVAWFLNLCPDEHYRDPRRALELAERVARLVPHHERDNPTMLGGIRPLLTLGLARYRLRDWEGARKHVEESIKIRGGGDAYEGFVLAMILAHLNDREGALARFHAANEHMRRNRFSDFELHFLREEAAGVLKFTPDPESGR